LVRRPVGLPPVREVVVGMILVEFPPARRRARGKGDGRDSR
jgi:hypothetical protein